jgi:hypothetical protein
MTSHTIHAGLDYEENGTRYTCLQALNQQKTADGCATFQDGILKEPHKELVEVSQWFLGACQEWFKGNPVAKNQF